jgi:hypothetical protein
MCQIRQPTSLIAHDGNGDGRVPTEAMAEARRTTKSGVDQTRLRPTLEDIVGSRGSRKGVSHQTTFKDSGGQARRPIGPIIPNR